MTFSFQALDLNTAPTLGDGEPSARWCPVLNTRQLCSRLPLALLPIPSPAHAETKRVIAAFERCLATSDMTGLSALRSSIEVRRPRAVQRASPSFPPPLASPHAQPRAAPSSSLLLQRRIDELDDFYHDNLVDERCGLFH